jgi:chromosome segregation ATPase
MSSANSSSAIATSVGDSLNTAGFLSADLGEPINTNEIEKILTSLEKIDPQDRSVVLVRELAKARQELELAHKNWEGVYNENAERAREVAQNLEEIKQLKNRTKQLAIQSKDQIKTIQDIVVSFDTLRQEVLRGLQEFKNIDELKQVVSQIDAARQSLDEAKAKIDGEGTGLYQSIVGLKNEAQEHHDRTQEKLELSMAELESVMAEFAVEKQKLNDSASSVKEAVSAGEKLADRLKAVQQEVNERADQMKADIARVNKEYEELTNNFGKDKEQFYQLTADAINKADAIRSQFAEINKKMTGDRDTLQLLKADVEDIKQSFERDTLQQVEQLSQHYKEAMESWGDVKFNQRQIQNAQAGMKNWAIGLTIGTVLASGLSVAALLKPASEATPTGISNPPAQVR